MCGRYDLNETPAQISLCFDLAEVPDFLPNRDARPTQRLPVVRLDREGRRTCDLLRWGLVPGWAEDPKMGNRLINARGETVDRLPSFRSAFKYRRCLVPASAYYEWPVIEGRKVRHRIARPDGKSLGLAGLWESWPAGEGAEPLHTFTIITTTPPPGIAWVHDRMPVVVAPEHYGWWLDPGSGPGQALIGPYDGDLVAVLV